MDKSVMDAQPLYSTEELRGGSSINLLGLRRSEKFVSVLEFRPTGHACFPLRSRFGQALQFTAVYTPI
jgi:hypothetical protein